MRFDFNQVILRSGTNVLAQENALRIYLDRNLTYMQRYLSPALPEARFQIPQATYLA
ncbi:hypothetical protein [Hydrogenophaga sp.]|uniref:hypothetical protein n=1 Tax=Hydrogenophaga sp. TaxID=1904254 RepID=UPI00262977BF|nr:hypothetical protein [Hydrogenophaga sp.]MCW5652449.1 hypothetical protein [Hydrogenophaga sp.]